MSNIFFGGLGESEFSKASAEPTRLASSAFRSNQETVFVDVGARKIDANVVRDGISVGVHEINQDVLDDIIIDRPPIRLTIVSQSVPAGTPVPVGTAIDVTMARPGQLPIGVITGVLTPVATLTVEEGFDRFVAGNPQVRRIVGRAGTGVVTAEDEQAVREIFLNQDIALTDEPGRDVTAAIETLRMLNTFGGA
jgi:hypothetical protein